MTRPTGIARDDGRGGFWAAVRYESLNYTYQLSLVFKTPERAIAYAEFYINYSFGR